MKTKGIIIKAIKLWMIKINTKAFRKGPLDGATFPYLVKIKYENYVKTKLVYVGNKTIKVGDEVTIYYNSNKPGRITKIEF